MAKLSSPDLKFINHEQFTANAEKLGEMVRATDLGINLIICINRGGSRLSRELSDMLGGLPIIAIGLQSYSGIHTRDKIIKTYQTLNPQEFSGKSVLLVDEICDQGDTLKFASKILQESGVPVKVITAAMIVRPRTEALIDFFVEVTEKWVVFPYEVHETTEALRSFWQHDPDLRRELFEYFTSLGKDPEAMAKLLC